MPRGEVETAGSEETSRSAAIDVRKTAVLLRAADVALRLSKTFREVLEEMITSGALKCCGADKMDQKKYSRKLKQEASKRVLTIIWKESSLVDPQACALAGMEKSFPTSQFGISTLAKLYAEQTISSESANPIDHFHATRGDISAIVNAAEAFGLIERNQISQTEKPINATSKLNELMSAVYERDSYEIRSLLTSLNQSTQADEG